MFKVPENYRVTQNSPFATKKEDGNNGVFKIPFNKNLVAIAIASDGRDWDHVSVRIVNAKTNEQRTPTWNQMCKIKSMFWTDDECVLQYHPAKEDYVNCHPNVLHLWKPQGLDIPKPLKMMV